MNRIRVIMGLVALLAIALVVAAARSRRRLDDAWDDEAEDDSTPVAVPVTTTRAPDPVVVPVGAIEESAPVAVPVAAAAAQTAAGETPFGPGSAVSGPDGAGPPGWVIKAKDESRLYHTPSSPSWERMHADAWFESEEAAEGAGFRRWDWRRSRT